MVAAVDCPNEFRLRRSRIAELLFSSESKRCFGCDHVELCVPLSAANGDNNNDDDDDHNGKMKTVPEVSNPVVSCGDIEALTEEMDEEMQLLIEVLMIKDVLTNAGDESEELCDSLRRLPSVALTFDILKSTEIGKAVNGLRKHTSSDVRHLAKLLIQVWKEMVDKWVAVTTENVEANNEGTPESVNPSVLDEEEGLPCPPLDEGAFFPTPQSMEFLQFFDGMDDDGNLPNSGEFSKNCANGRKPPNDNQDMTKRKLQPTNNGSVLGKEHSGLHEHNNQATVSHSKKPSNVHSGPGRPQKSSAELQTSSLVKQLQALDKTPAQRKPLTGHHDKSKPPERNLEAMKRKLQESYQEPRDNVQYKYWIQFLSKPLAILKGNKAEPLT